MTKQATNSVVQIHNNNWVYSITRPNFSFVYFFHFIMISDHANVQDNTIIKFPNTLTSEERQKLQIEADSRSIFVTNIHKDITPEAIEERFGKCGSIERITVVTDVHHRDLAHAYIEFENKESMENALILDKTKIDDKIITVTKKRTNVHAYNKHNIRMRKTKT